MKPFFLITLFFISLNSNAQHTGPVLKFNIPSLIDDISFPTIQAGIETKLSDKWSWYQEAGIKYRRSYIESNDTSFIRTGGFKLKTELRRYLRNNTVPYGIYAGFNLFYTNDRDHTEVNYTRPAETVERADVFAVRKQVYGFNLITGAQKSWKNGLVTDFYAGIGLRYRKYDVSHLEYRPKVDSIHTGPDYNFAADRMLSEAEERDHIMANFTIGLRMGFRL